jgi:hypothetical protein
MRFDSHIDIGNPDSPIDSNRLSKNGASGRDPALRGSCKCSHISLYAALSKPPRALADGPMLVFQHPVNAQGAGSRPWEMLA